MSKFHSNLIRELVDPNEIISITESSKYPRPRWMLNSSVEDENWLVSKVGFDLPKNKHQIHHYRNISFAKSVSKDECLTDEGNKALLNDIRNSLLYLDVTGRITRPGRISDILITSTKLILHANELRALESKPKVRHLTHITWHDIEDYLLSFGVERPTFEITLETILSRWNSKEEIDWHILQQELGLTTRRFMTLQHKLLKCLKSKIDHFAPKTINHYRPEYRNASDSKFEIDIDLFPSEKTISNEISKLEALYTSRPAQKYKFQHSTSSLISSSNSFFNALKQPQKTLTMPINVSLHALSCALKFCRNYGKHLRHYIRDLTVSEKEIISKFNCHSRVPIKSTTLFKSNAYNATPIPQELMPLNITSWDSETFENISPSELRSGMSVGAAILLYIASIWILTSSFTAGRMTSLLTLKRNCFKHSPIDGLFDISMRIPKSSERLELEEVLRPIPDLIYDYGLEFAALACELEERRGYYANEEEVFLFGRILSLHSYDATAQTKNAVYKYPLSDDTIKKAIYFFQDWSESPLINGRRWYPSTHQYRKLFAVLYFNFSEQEGLEELSWFMGHSSLEQTFHYAEISPSDEWIEEAESCIARRGAILNQNINSDSTIKKIINQAREKSTVALILEPLIQTMINDHKKETGEEVRFYKIEGEDVFFYFHDPKGE
ncbi:hypothetical protein [Vibrio vulnificus]|uniref:hypothetical protein n=1 Tax=Vibrio vulnificus TaxID=672 RepID=UPI003241C902